MIKAKDRNYYVNEKQIKEVYESNNKRFIAVLDTGEKIEIDELTYLSLGGE